MLIPRVKHLPKGPDYAIFARNERDKFGIAMLKETMTMPNEALDELGAFLMRNVRDPSIESWRLQLEGRMHSADVRKAILQGMQPGCREAVSKLLPAIVDEVLHSLLFGIQASQNIKLLVTVKGQSVDAADVSDGLQGEPWGSRGWIATFSAYQEPDLAI
jgi:hypothetical protein